MIYWDFASSKLQVFAKLRLLWREAVAVAKDHTTDLADGFRVSEVNLQKKKAISKPRTSPKWANVLERFAIVVWRDLPWFAYQ